MKTWRELIAEAPLRPPEDVSEETHRPKPKTPQKPDSLRVGDPAKSPAKSDDVGPKEGLPRQRLIRTGPTTWVEAAWCRGLCVHCDRPLAPGSVIACEEHQRVIGQLVMPWDEQP